MSPYLWKFENTMKVSEHQSRYIVSSKIEREISPADLMCCVPALFVVRGAVHKKFTKILSCKRQKSSQLIIERVSVVSEKRLCVAAEFPPGDRRHHLRRKSFFQRERKGEHHRKGTAYCLVTMSRTDCQGPSRIKSYYVEGGFSHLIHMTAAHLW